MPKVKSPFKDAADLHYWFLPELTIEIVENLPNKLIYAGN